MSFPLFCCGVILLRLFSSISFIITAVLRFLGLRSSRSAAAPVKTKRGRCRSRDLSDLPLPAAAGGMPDASCMKLGIGIVACSPIGRGFFAGKGATEDLPENSILTIHPRFIGDNLEKNKVLYDRVQKLASKHCCSSAQLALSWVLHQGNDVVPIPGTRKIKNMVDNIGSLNVPLSEEDLKEISDAVRAEEVAGSWVYTHAESYTWKYANTPPKVTDIPT